MFVEIISIINLVLLLICILLVALNCIKSQKKVDFDIDKKIKDLKKELLDDIQRQINVLNNSIETLKNNNINFQDNVSRNLTNGFKDINDNIINNNERFTQEIKTKLEEFSKTIREKMLDINQNVKEKLESIQKDNNDKLENIKGIVDEKLQKTLEDRLNSSFNNVIEQIGGVNKAIGEIKGIATDVGSLKTVLTNVKTKGIVGEVILGNLIREILSPNQYEENVITKLGSNNRVEFAIKMPGAEPNSFIYLPVDSKFPTESYHRILEAIEKCDKEAIDSARSALKTSIKSFAKEISFKYIDEPNTTSFAIMFLPIEGLYAEVINLGLFEELQKEKINVAGPSTFAALLNALQMGFKTLVIQKKSADVFKLLGAVKTEFEKFASLLEKTKKKVDDAGEDLDKLVGPRTKAIQRKLKEFEVLPPEESADVLEIDI